MLSLRRGRCCSDSRRWPARDSRKRPRLPPSRGKRRGSRRPIISRTKRSGVVRGEDDRGDGARVDRYADQPLSDRLGRRRRGDGFRTAVDIRIRILKYVSVGADGTVWGINASDPDRSALRKLVAARAGRVEAGFGRNTSNIWGVNASDQIYRWNGSSWASSLRRTQARIRRKRRHGMGSQRQRSDLPPHGKQLDADPGRAETDLGRERGHRLGRECQRSDLSLEWQQLDAGPGALKHVSAGFDGSVFGVNASDNIYRYLGNNELAADARGAEADLRFVGDAAVGRERQQCDLHRQRSLRTGLYAARRNRRSSPRS